MRDVFGVHRRRVTSALRSQLRAGDAVQGFARDDLERDYWVLTNQELLQLHSTGAIRARVLLADVVGAVNETSGGVSVRVSSRRDAGRTLIGSFRTPNEVTRRLADLLDPQRLA